MTIITSSTVTSRDGTTIAYDQTGIPWPVNQAVYVDYMLYNLRGYHRLAEADLVATYRATHARTIEVPVAEVPVGYLPVLRAQMKVLQPWLQDDQVEDAIRQLQAWPGKNLLQNNQHVFRLLQEGVSVGENRATAEKSPTVRFVDFEHVANNRFMAVCQFKVRIRGTEHHIIPDMVLFVNGLPLVVIEAKSAKVKDALPEAFDQLMRYSEQRGSKGHSHVRAPRTRRAGHEPGVVHALITVFYG